MKKYSWIIIVVVILVIAGLFISQRNTQTAKSFNIGLISILSGEYAAVGENFKNGVVLASEQYNTKHPDAPITLTIEDDGFSGGKGVSAYHKLVDVNKIDGLINVSSPTIDSIYDEVVKTMIPVIQGGEQGREALDDNVFGIFPDSVSSEYDYGVYMRQKGVKEMAIVSTKLGAFVRFVDAFKKGFQGKVTEYVIDPSEKDFRTHALKVADTKPESIGIFMYPQQGAQFLKEFLKVKKNKPQMFLDSSFVTGNPDYQRILGDLSVLDGSYVGTIESTVSDEFKTTYKAKFNAEAGFLADIGYDAFNILAESHDANSKTWLTNIKNINHKGASGPTQFNTTGNRLPQSKVQIVSGGKMVDLPK